MSDTGGTENGNGRMTIAQLGARVSDTQQSVRDLDERFEKHREVVEQDLKGLTKAIAEVNTTVAVIAAVKQVEEKHEDEGVEAENRAEEKRHRRREHVVSVVSTLAFVVSCTVAVLSVLH